MNLKKILGLLAVGGLLVLGAPTQQAQAASPLSPGIAAAVQEGTSSMATEVQYRRHHHHYQPRRHIHRHYVHPRHHFHPRRHHHSHRHHHHRHRR